MKKLVSMILCLAMVLGISAFALAEDSVYPIAGDIHLTYFGQLHKKVAAAYSGWEDLDVVQEWFKTTGVTLDFQCPPAGMVKEQFNLMLASGDYTDLIVHTMVQLEGGLTKLYEDGVIIDLTEYLPEYAPNYWKYLTENPDVMKEVCNDDGRIFCFVFAKGGGYLLSTQGPIVRGDILTDLGIESPKTIDEWEEMLRAVKSAYPDMIPFTGYIDDLLYAFSPAYGTSWGEWYEDDEGKAHYAPIEGNFKEYLTRMNKWYQEGLIDNDFVALTNDDAGVDNKMSAGIAFATFGAGSAQIAAYMKANADSETFSTIGVRVPTLDAAEQAKYTTEYSATANNQCAISTSCKNVEAAIRMLDWGYGEEGNRRLNWGVEGVSYELDENGEPHYTELVLNNPDGLSIDAALANYALVAVKGPAMLVQDPRYMMDYYALDEQKQAMQNWSDKDLTSHLFPNVSYTEEESSGLTSLMSDITTYTDSMIIKFIVGTEPLENFDSYVQTVKNMGIDNAIDIQQAAVDRYNAR